jgi:glucose-1-phosphate cytidylyltransferase
MDQRGPFVLEPEIFSYIKGNPTIIEATPLQNIARNEQLSAYRHARGSIAQTVNGY